MASKKLLAIVLVLGIKLKKSAYNKRKGKNKIIFNDVFKMFMGIYKK